MSAALAEIESRVRLRLPRSQVVLGPAEIDEHIRAVAPLLDTAGVAELRRRLAAHAQNLGPLEELRDDETVSDILVNSQGDVWVERCGVLQRTDLELAAETVNLLVERVVTPLGLRADRSSPVVDARLPDGSRVCIVLPPLAPDGPVLAIRRFSVTTLPLAAFGSPSVVRELERLVAERRNVVVFGGTGAGKTTLLNALAAGFAPHERVVTVEDAAELRLPGEHVVRLECRPPGPEGFGEVTMRQLVRTALRLRPDRIVVGEVRGPEALDMVTAMSSGHTGSLSTCHADSARDALLRLETMVLTASTGLPLEAVRARLASAVHALVGLRRSGDGRRAVGTITTVAGHDGRRYLLAEHDGEAAAAEGELS